jgi:energy-coupling factor transporter ATP-binding protein EcfA2
MNSSWQMDPLTIRTSLETHIADDAQLYKGDDGEVYARFRSEDSIKVAPLDSKECTDWQIQHCMQYSIPVKADAIKLAVASAKSNLPSKPAAVCVRVGARSDRNELYWDLADGTGRAVKVTPDGWSMVDDAAVLFPFSPGRGVLTEPSKAGSIHCLREKFDLSAYNEALIISFCLGCLRGKGPYPILAIVGPEGSGKTTLAAYLRALVDPGTPMLRNMPKKDTELAISARDNHLLAYDGIEAVPAWFGRAICKVSKGTVFSSYLKGQERILFQGARPVILAGAEEMLLDRELASRTLIVRLEARTRFQSNMTEDFEGLAEMRGALLDVISHALGRWRDINIPEPRKDYEFEKWMAACDLSRWGLETFQDAYETGISDAVSDAVELDPFLLAFQTYMSKVGTFRGTAGELLRELNGIKGTFKGNRWPKTPRAIAGRLRRDRKLLPEVDMEFEIREGHNRTRVMAARSKLPVEMPQIEVDEPKTKPEAVSNSRNKGAAKKAADLQLGLFGMV